MSAIENSSGVHSKESKQIEGKTTAEKFGKHCKIDDYAVSCPYTIDINKRGKIQDITNKEYVLTEPKLDDKEK